MRSRGQVLPMWTIGIIATFSLMFLAMNYANSIRYQIRAQNAADAAAAALITIQAQRWNEMTASLYAANVEEYRARTLLDGMLLTIDSSGGCDPQNGNGIDPKDCNRVYSDERTAYLRSASRYSADVQMLQNSTFNSTNSIWATDAQTLLNSLKTSCNNAQPTVTQASVEAIRAAGGDCAFTYQIVGTQQRPNLKNVMSDAYGILVPSLGSDAAAGYAQESPDLWAPVSVDVLVCATVPPLIPNFGPIHFAPFKAAARGAATDVMVEQDWMMPGATVDPQRANGSLFQPDEIYTPNNPNGFYNVSFGGDPSTIYGNGYGAQITSKQMMVRIGWWGPIPTQPLSTSVVPSC